MPRAPSSNEANRRALISPAALFVNVMARIRDGGETLGEQAQDAVDDHPRLARTRPRQHQIRTCGREYRFFLLGIQVFQVVHGYIFRIKTGDGPRSA